MNRIVKWAALPAAVALSLAAWGIAARVHTDHGLQKTADDAAVPSVVTVRAHAAPASEEIVLPGSVSPAFDAALYARTNGYLKRWYVDIGDHVKAGQVLAEINSPEIDQQLLQARADLLAAKANSRVAGILAQRERALVPASAVSQQASDQATSDASARAANVASGEANVDRLEQLVSFEKIISPYDGVVTARNTDIGHLINAGSNNGPELFEVADVSWLRIFVQVPQTDAPFIQPGVDVTLHFPEYPGQVFLARLLSTARALDPMTRTLRTQLRIDNDRGLLFPGGYVEVHFKLHAPTRGVRVPANALLFRAEGLRVATLAPDGRVSLRSVTEGRDFGTEVEILTGVKAGETIIINPPAALTDGDHVKVLDTSDKK